MDLRIPKNRELTAGDLLAQCLHTLGVHVAFGLHGGHLDSFLMGCHDIGIKLVDTRHETVAIQAAEGYAKVSGKVGACFVTANSGYGCSHYRLRSNQKRQNDFNQLNIAG
jgi:thiamine pyrophosphate-dependent acetolactate synthase large subunit-like protein